MNDHNQIEICIKLRLIRIYFFLQLENTLNVLNQGYEKERKLKEKFKKGKMKTAAVSVTSISRPAPKSNLKTHISTCTNVYTPVGKNKLLVLLQSYKKKTTTENSHLNAMETSCSVLNPSPILPETNNIEKK